MKRAGKNKPQLVCFDFHHLGDALLTFPFLRGAMEQYEVTVCCRAAAAPVFRWLGDAVSILEWEPRWRAGDAAGLSRLKDWKQVEVGVCGWADPRVHGLMRDLGIPNRVGYPVNTNNYFADEAALEWPKRIAAWMWQQGAKWSGGNLLTRPLQRSSRWCSHLSSWQWIADDLGVPFRTELPWFHIGTEALDEEWQKAMQDWLSEGTCHWIIHPGARVPCRRWAMRNFDLLARIMNDALGITVLVVLPPGMTWSGERGARVVVCPTLDHLARSVNAAQGVVCHDSFAAHLGAALGKKVVSIFGSMNPCWFAPYENEAGVVGQATTGRFWRCWLKLRGRSLADSVSVDEVVERVRTFID
ncbi:MAG: glycosyltransferase family 9 protein [Candidatus Methylacidiphilales bacterium]